jgi:hypothetical protein
LTCPGGPAYFKARSLPDILHEPERGYIGGENLHTGHQKRLRKRFQEDGLDTFEANVMSGAFAVAL